MQTLYRWQVTWEEAEGTLLELERGKEKTAAWQRREELQRQWRRHGPLNRKDSAQPGGRDRRFVVWV